MNNCGNVPKTELRWLPATGYVPFAEDPAGNLRFLLLPALTLALAEWPGPPIGDEEGQIIHEALGNKRAILLAHHGQLVATATIEEAAVLAVFIERAARMQVLAQSIGTIKSIDPPFAREAHDYRLKPRAVAATFHYFGRRVLKQEPDVLA